MGLPCTVPQYVGTLEPLTWCPGHSRRATHVARVQRGPGRPLLLLNRAAAHSSARRSPQNFERKVLISPTTPLPPNRIVVFPRSRREIGYRREVADTHRRCPGHPSGISPCRPYPSSCRPVAFLVGSSSRPRRVRVRLISAPWFLQIREEKKGEFYDTLPLVSRRPPVPSAFPSYRTVLVLVPVGLSSYPFASHTQDPPQLRARLASLGEEPSSRKGRA